MAAAESLSSAIQVSFDDTPTSLHEATIRTRTGLISCGAPESALYYSLCFHRSGWLEPLITAPQQRQPNRSQGDKFEAELSPFIGGSTPKVEVRCE
jgi:hypothetical protein